MNQRLKNILLNNWTISFFIASLIIIVTNPVRNKFTLAELPVESIGSERKIYFVDLDSDGKSERIALESNQVGNGCIKIYNPNHLGQFNSQTVLPKITHNFLTADWNGDEFSEIYFCGLRNDSVFLNSIDYKTLDNPVEYFIDTIKPNADVITWLGRGEDLDSDGRKEILLAINSGFSLQPRKIYALTLQNGKVFRSPFTGAKANINQVEDLDGDGKPEIVCGTFATRNYPDSVKYSDYYSWLFVFDNKLNFKFEPVKISELKASTKVELIEKKGEKFLFAFMNVKEDYSRFMPYKIVNSRGELVAYDSIILSTEPIREYGLCPVYHEKKKTTELNLITLDGTFFRIDDNFKPEKIRTVDGLHYPRVLNRLDLNGDGQKETILQMGTSNELVFVDPSFRWFSYLRLSVLPGLVQHSGLVKGYDNQDVFYFQSENKLFFISYRENFWWDFRFLIWATIFGAVFGLVLFLQYVQQERLKTQLEERQQLKELQFKVITSQLNPHFTFNALNMLSSSVYDPKKPELYDRFTTFSRLIRSILSDSDKIMRPLREELRFTEDFLKIQKYRFRDAFVYEIEIGRDVDQMMMVPKLIVQIFVENAIKHAFPAKMGEDKLNIRVHRKNHFLMIEIEDNGIGREQSKDKQPRQKSTGMGLSVMNEYIGLLNRQNFQKIEIKITDINDKGKTGTRVDVKVPEKFDYKIK